MSNATQTPSKGDITIVMEDLNAKVDPDNILLGYVMGKHALVDQNNNSLRQTYNQSNPRNRNQQSPECAK